MSTNNLTDKLDDFFDLSKKKQKKKHDKLASIIKKLEDKKDKIKKELIKESERDETSSKFVKLGKELKVISKMIKKARKHDK